MIRSTYSDVDIFVLNDGPDWDEPVTMDVELLADLTTSLTGREGRRPMSGKLRIPRFNYNAVVTGVAAREFTECLRDYQTQPVIVPLWPAAVRSADIANIISLTGYWLVWNEDWSVWSIVVANTVVPANRWVAPALWGRLDKREARPLSGDALEFDVNFIEQSDATWAMTPRVVAWTAGPVPSDPYIGIAPKILPFEINFEQPVQSFEVGIVRQQIGFGRQPSETLYPQTNVRGQKIATVTTDGPEMGHLLRFFMDHGAGKSFWAAQWTQALALTAAIEPADTVLHVDDSSTVRVGDFLVIENLATARVLGVGAGTVTIDAAFGAEFGVGTLISQLMLCRFEKTRFSLQWLNAAVAEATLMLKEVPAEYDPPDDETLGTSIGLLTTRVYTYTFSSIGNGGITISSVFTSYEENSGGGTPAKISHAEVRQGIALESDEVQVTMAIEEGVANPLLDLATLRQEMPLFITIKENGAAVFYGEVTKVSVKGSMLKATAVSGGTLFDRSVPRARFQLGCNNALYDAGCKINRAGWAYTGNLHADVVAGYPFQVVIDSLGVPLGNTATPPANFFSLGYFEILTDTGSDIVWQIRPVLVSTAYAAGLMTLTLDRDLDPLGLAGDGVLIVAGCDLTATTCRGKFQNFSNFFGHPYLPLANPSAVKKNPSTGGKK